MKARRALISVHDTTGLTDFVQRLQRLGIEVVAADGTEQHLRDAGIEVKGVEQHIGAKALAGGGHVKSMHPQLSNAILWGRDAGDLEGLEGADDLGFDIVVVNLMPFERVAARRDTSEDQVLEAIDLRHIAAHYDYHADTIWVDALDAAHFFFCIRSEAHLYAK